MRNIQSCQKNQFFLKKIVYKSMLSRHPLTLLKKENLSVIWKNNS